MNEDDYYEKSRLEGLPKRCPILNYCQRRALTIFCFQDYERINNKNGITKTLQNEGIIPLDFDENAIQLQGEKPIWKKSDIHMYYYNMCPEVNLFDHENAIRYALGIASSDGEWDDFREENKFENWKSKHYSECPEFNMYYFNKENFIYRKSLKRKRIGISKKLRFEVFQRDNFTCYYCGLTKKDGIKLEIDHKILVSAGGTDDYGNLVTSCMDCNRGKDNKIIIKDI